MTDITIEPITPEEEAELKAPSEEHTDEIEIEDDEVDDAEETEDESGINDENYLEFLPEYSDDVVPNINSIAPTGLFGITGPSEVPYLEAPPEPQDGFEDGEGV